MVCNLRMALSYRSKPLPTLTVPPAGGGTIRDSDQLHSAGIRSADGRTGILLEAGSGWRWTTRRAVLRSGRQRRAPTPEEAPILARRGVGGTIIIIWPDPCGTIRSIPIRTTPPLGSRTGANQPWEFTPQAGTPRCHPAPEIDRWPTTEPPRNPGVFESGLFVSRASGSQYPT